MNLFGLSITRARKKALPSGFQTVEASRGWFPLVAEGFTGAWQRNIVARRQDILTLHAVYACISLIASDIAKLRIKLMAQSADQIWSETENSAFSPVLRKPNRYQTRITFLEQWVSSKLIHGNAYILKQRDQRGLVTDLYPLDPQRVRVQVAPDGSVFYALGDDNLAGTPAIVVPAREIIHDICVALYHPLCGISPLTACALAATQGLRVQEQSSGFFENGATPSGILTSPDPLDAVQAKTIQDQWEKGFTGQNFGKVAVLGFGFKYEPMTMSAVDAQLVEQLKMTAEAVCTAFHVPPYMIGVGPPPNYNNIEALNQQYYSQCLQNPIEKIELLLDEGLGLAVDGGPQKLGVELDLDDLLRMDTSNRVRAAGESIKAGMSINEARKTYFGLGKVEGGDTPFLQEQNWPIALLAQREIPERPPTAPAPVTPPSESDPKMLRAEAKAMAELYLQKKAA